MVTSGHSDRLASTRSTGSTEPAVPHHGLHTGAIRLAVTEPHDYTARIRARRTGRNVGRPAHMGQVESERRPRREWSEYRRLLLADRRHGCVVDSAHARRVERIRALHLTHATVEHRGRVDGVGGGNGPGVLVEPTELDEATVLDTDTPVPAPVTVPPEPDPRVATTDTTITNNNTAAAAAPTRQSHTTPRPRRPRAAIAIVIDVHRVDELGRRRDRLRLSVVHPNPTRPTPPDRSRPARHHRSPARPRTPPSARTTSPAATAPATAPVTSCAHREVPAPPDSPTRRGHLVAREPAHPRAPIRRLLHTQPTASLRDQTVDIALRNDRSGGPPDSVSCHPPQPGDQNPDVVGQVGDDTSVAAGTCSPRRFLTG